MKLLNWTAILAIVVAVCLSLRTIAPRNHHFGDPVIGTAFALTDKNGQVRGLWSLAEDGAPRLEMYDNAGRATLALGASEQSSYVTIFNKDGSPSVSIGDDSENNHVLVYDKSGDIKIKMIHNKMGNAIGIHDESGEPGIMAIVSRDDDERTIVASGPKSKIYLNLEPTGRSMLSVSNINNESSTTIIEDPITGSNMNMIDRLGNRVELVKPFREPPSLKRSSQGVLLDRE